MDITKIGSLSDYIREFEMEKAEEEKSEQEGKMSSGIKTIFSGDEVPTKETLESFADANDLTFEEVVDKVLAFAFDEFKEEKEESDEDESQEGEKDEESSSGFTPKKAKGSSGSFGGDSGLKSAKAYGGMNGGGKFVNEDEEQMYSPDNSEEEQPQEEETPNPFNVGDFVSIDTDDHENMFYGKKLEVTDVDGDFVQVLLVDPNGIETQMWFKSGELREEVKASSDEDNTENVEETNVMESDGESDEKEELEESFGIYSHLKKYLGR